MISPQQVLANVMRWRVQHGLVKKPVQPVKPKSWTKFEQNKIKLSSTNIVLDIDPNTGEVQVPQ